MGLNLSGSGSDCLFRGKNIHLHGFQCLNEGLNGSKYGMLRLCVSNIVDAGLVSDASAT